MPARQIIAMKLHRMTERILNASTSRSLRMQRNAILTFDNSPTLQSPSASIKFPEKSRLKVREHPLQSLHYYTFNKCDIVIRFFFANEYFLGRSTNHHLYK